MNGGAGYAGGTRVGRRLDVVPNDLGALVAPGWLPLLLVGVLAGLMVLLWLNMRKHLRKIDVPVDEDLPISSRFAPDEEEPAR